MKWKARRVRDLGACCLMGTANRYVHRRNCALCATDPALEKLAEEAGRKVMELLEKDIKARDIMSQAAFTNAVKVCCATSGSTNLTRKGCDPGKKPDPKITKGYLAHFAKYATSADKGANLE